MNLKLLIFLTWLFYVIERRTADELWFYCMVCSGILAMCAYFYRKENHEKPIEQLDGGDSNQNK